MEELFKIWEIDTKEPVGLIFDVDELLYNNEKDIYDAYHSILLSRNLPIEEGETFPGKDLFDIVTRLKEKYNIFESVEELVEERRANYIETLHSSESLIKEGVKELFNFLDSNKDVLNVRVAYATSSEKAFTDIIFKRLFKLANLARYIDEPDAFFYHNNEGINASTCWVPGERKKPESDVYLETLSKLELPASQCIAFEDSKSGYLSAKGAGINSIVIPSTWSERYFEKYHYGINKGEGICKLNSLAEVLPLLETIKKHETGEVVYEE